MGEEKIFTDKVLYDTFMEMNKNLTNMNAELKNLRKDFGDMNELRDKYDRLNAEVSIIKNERLGSNKTLEFIRNWGALAVALGALLWNINH